MSDIAGLIHDLEQAVSSGTPSRRLEALTKITDLFLAGSGAHTDDRLALFDGVFLALVHTIEVNARAQLSRRHHIRVRKTVCLWRHGANCGLVH